MIPNLQAKLQAFEAYLQDFFQENRAVGMSIGIVYQGETVYAKGFGHARRGDVQQPITPDTMMSIQSVSKNFTALSLLQLVERGLIALDVPLVKYLPYFRTTDKAVSDQITVRQLLSHTAGFPGEIGIANLISPNARAYYDSEEEWQEDLSACQLTEEILARTKSREDVTRFLAEVNLGSAPGQEWCYCTDAYVVAGDLFDKVADSLWEAHVQAEIFDRLGMSRTTANPIRVQEDSDSAIYYEVTSEGATPVPFPVNPVYAPIGFLYSTANDMLKYLAAQMKPEESGILRWESVQEMQKPIAKVFAPWQFGEEAAYYGLGCITESYKGVKLVEHGGGFIGVRARISMVPSHQLGVVVMLNFNTPNTHKIARKAIDLLLDFEK